jgi:alpha-N-arabinofuranosidase
VSLSTPLRGFDGGELVEAVVIADEDLTAANTQDDPDRVVPRPHPQAAVTDGVLTADLPPASWNMFLVRVP